MKSDIILNRISNTIEFTPGIDLIKINLKNIIQAMGYKDSLFPYRELLNDLYLEAKEIVKPRCGFVRIPSAKCNPQIGEIDIDGVVFKVDKIIASSLKDISEVVFYVSTVGNEFNIWLDEKKKEEDPFLEYLSNLIGSEITEGIAEWIYKKIVNIVQKKGLFASNRYSPGYCGWNVEEQKKLFSFFPDNICGISLTDSALMIPIKSTSGLVGVGKKVEWMDYPCDVCNAKHCYKNRRSILV